MLNFFERIKDRIQGKAKKGEKRSPLWLEVRNDFVSKHSKCAVCESEKKLEVHHIIPFHLAPDLELDHSNLITLCRRKKYGIHCHLLIGHLGNYRRVNTNCPLDAMTWNYKIKAGRHG